MPLRLCGHGGANRRPTSPPQNQEAGSARSGGQGVEGADQGGLENRRAPVVTDAAVLSRVCMIRLPTALSYLQERVPKRVPNEQSLQITNYQTLAITRFFEASKGVWIGS